MNNEDKVNYFLYDSEIKKEILWRKSQASKKDLELLDSLISEVNNYGYQFNYFVDLTHRDIKDFEVLSVIQKYIDKFEDKGKSAQLVNVIGATGNTLATETIINNFNILEGYRGLAVFYDNALARLQDKRYISEYLKWLSVPEVANWLPLTMIMLGKWNVNEAKEIFIKYLSFDRTDELIYTSITALSYYKDEEVFYNIKNMENHPNTNVKKAAIKVINKLNKKQKR